MIKIRNKKDGLIKNYDFDGLIKEDHTPGNLGYYYNGGLFLFDRRHFEIVE